MQDRSGVASTAIRNVPVIGFPRGAGAMYPEYRRRETGVAAVALDSAVPLGWARKTMSPPAPVQPGVALAGQSGPDADGNRGGAI